LPLLGPQPDYLVSADGSAERFRASDGKLQRFDLISFGGKPL